MQTDNIHPVDQLLGVIPDHPALRIMHFVDTHSILIDTLAKLTAARDYEYRLLCFDDVQYQLFARRFDDHHAIQIKHATHTQPRYHIQAKLYDYVFVEATLPDPDAFLKKVYTSMKNAAMIFILIPTNTPKAIEPWQRAAEEHYFVAFNTFQLTDTVQIISAKKMHGWGG
jgi:hypothetical protein